MVTLALYGLLAIGLVVGLFMIAARFLPAGEQIAPPVRDEPIWAMPGDRALSPSDIAEVRLPVALRGYRFAETDMLLDRLGEELRARDEQIARLRGELPAAAEEQMPEPAASEPDVPAPDAELPEDEAERAQEPGTTAPASYWGGSTAPATPQRSAPEAISPSEPPPEQASGFWGQQAATPTPPQPATPRTPPPQPIRQPDPETELTPTWWQPPPAATSAPQVDDPPPDAHDG